MVSLAEPLTQFLHSEILILGMNDKNQKPEQNSIPQNKKPASQNVSSNMSNVQNPQNVNNKPSPPAAASKNQQLSPKSKLKSKPVIATVIIFFFVILFLLLLMFMSSGDSEQETPEGAILTSTPTPQPNITSSPELIPPSEDSDGQSQDFKTFKSDKLLGLDFPGFSVTYPSGYTLQNQRSDSGQFVRIFLTRNNHRLIIEQRKTDNETCIYDDDFAPEGEVYIDLRGRQYQEFEAGSELYRKSKNEAGEQTFYIYCEEIGWDFLTPTTYGIIIAQVPANSDSQILAEIDDIIKSIKRIR
ncbi:MAG: hypothetical protein A3A51_05180 [Candidatus Levybacteria bacterium RIFCSPLOWO2_01_FULL_39_10]|nr:MAG: hypothetical protein A3A51_05180 [Candidatus Levybacteria bacterium RIFCSPLOWO2_01_FULL_39_10]